MRLLARSSVLALALLAFVDTSGYAVPSVGPPPGTPDPKSMVLTTADLHARVTKQRYFLDSGFLSLSYEREFGSGRVGASRLINASSVAEIGPSAQVAMRFLATLRRVYGSKKTRAALAKGFAEGVGKSEIPVSKLQVGHVRVLGVGPGSFDLPMSAKVLGVRTDLHIAVFRVDRTLGGLVAVGAPGSRLPIAAMTRLARLMTSRMATQLVPRNVVPPTLTGTAQSGQTLTAVAGTWSGAAATFIYQWERCDATGANCTDVPGAVASSYVVQDADVGSTLRVKVTATNPLGSASAESAPSAVVSLAPAPLPR